MLTWVTRSATERGVPARRAWLVALAPLVGLGVILLLRFAHMGLFRLVIEEDGVVEWMQFLAFAGCAVVAALIVIERVRTGHYWQTVIFAVAAAGLAFVAGEEIAWGQRIVSLETPEWLREINLQEEVTVHNIAGVLFWFNMVLLFTSLYAIAADPMNWRTRYAETWDRGRALFVPPFFLASAFAIMAALRLWRLLSGTEPIYTVTKMVEWAELCYAAAVLYFLWLGYRALRTDEVRHNVASSEPMSAAG